MKHFLFAIYWNFFLRFYRYIKLSLKYDKWLVALDGETPPEGRHYGVLSGYYNLIYKVKYFK